jgi:serine/threonine protein kinase/tetratricopeptide (TPR) repeat protein
MPEPGITIGPYFMGEPLGVGAMGVVYRATHRETGRTVALKTVRLANEAVLQSLRREVRALASLRHPGIVQILDEGVDSGLPWYAMELIEGRTLRQVVAELHPPPQRPGPGRGGSRPTGGDDAASPTATAPAAWWTSALPRDPTRSLFAATGAPGVPARPGRAEDPLAVPVERRPAAGGALAGVLPLMRRLCFPLAFLHGEGLVHRDLKPDNVFVRPDATPVLVDFGLLSQFSGPLGRERFEIAGGTVGTAAYMAPEQVRGDLVDARADLYALGCIYYELLTGRKPFLAERLQEVLRLHLVAQPLPPSALVNGVPAQLDRLVLDLLKKDPRERVGHADDVAACLAELLPEPERGEPLHPVPKPYLYRPGFGGRTEGLRRLLDLVERLPAGSGCIALVGGESGAGKTRLAMELAREAELGHVRVLVGECPAPAGPGSGAAPLAPLHAPLQAISDLCLEGGLAETERLLGPRGKLLAPYAPELGDLPGQERHPEPAALPSDAARLRLLQALTETFAALAKPAASAVDAGRVRGLLLVLDDLQWADELTLAWLHSLLRPGTVEALPLLVLGTYRSEEVGTRGPAALQALLEAPGVERLSLGRIDEAAVGAMVADMLALAPPPPRLVRLVALRSEGNPFFVAETLRAAVAEGLLQRGASGRWQMSPALEAASDQEALPLPATVRNLVERRLGGLSPRALELGGLAAVLGRELATAQLLGAAGLARPGAAPEPALDALAELLRRQVLEETVPGRVQFLHDQIREAAYGQLAPEALRRLHRAAAEALAAGPDPDPAALGYHWERAGALEPARACYLAAARSAAARHALEEAERLYRAFLALGPSASETLAARRELAHDVLVVRGRVPEAIHELERAIKEARLVGDPAAEGLCLVELGRAHFLVSRFEDARRFYTQALEVLRQAGKPRGQALALHGLGITEDVQGRLDSAEGLYSEALAAARADGDRAQEAAVLGGLAVLESKRGRFDKACELHEQALDAARSLGSRNDEAVQLGNLAILRRRQGRFHESQELSERSAALFRATGYLRFESIALMNLANVLVDLGRLVEARTRIEEALDLQRKSGDGRIEAHALLYAAGLERRGMGDLARALDLIEAAERRPGAAEDPALRLECLCERGHIALAQGRSPEEVLRRLEGLPEASKPGAGSSEGAALARFERAVAAAAAGRALVHGECLEDLPDGLRRWIAQREPELWNRIARRGLAQAEDRSSQGG